MRLLMLSIAALLGLSVGSAFADAMNGYTLKQFGDFLKWRQVTVRFRKDTDELRFVYANELAWNALSEGRTDFPDGAVFVKVGAMTEPDPAFVSSATPSGARRIQVMVRDRQRHPEEDGWGYALFDTSGKVLAENVKQTTQACVACHRLVPDRGEVFSQIFKLEPGKSQFATWQSRVRFEAQKVSDLPKAIRGYLPKSATMVRSVQGALTDNPFAGTLDEVQPLLAAESIRSSLPAILISKNKKDFSLTVPKLSGEGCTGGKSGFKGIHTLPAGKAKIFQNDFCQ